MEHSANLLSRVLQSLLLRQKWSTLKATVQFFRQFVRQLRYASLILQYQLHLLAIRSNSPSPPLLKLQAQLSLQVEYVKRGVATPSSRRRHCLHTLTGLAGLGCFAAEDAAVRRGIHATHPLWHCLSCFALSSGNSLPARTPAVCLNTTQ